MNKGFRQFLPRHKVVHSWATKAEPKSPVLKDDLLLKQHAT